MKKIFLSSLLLVCAFNACTNYNQAINSNVHYPIQPETLLDYSSERTSFALSNESSIQDLTEWLNNDQPSRAELSCTKGDIKCRKAEQVLHSFGVPFTHVQGNKTGVALVYDRIVARDCNVANTATGKLSRQGTITPFGCSVAVNILQMVGDHQQFAKPNLLGYRDASKAVRHYDNYTNFMK